MTDGEDRLDEAARTIRLAALVLCSLADALFEDRTEAELGNLASHVRGYAEILRRRAAALSAARARVH